MVRAAESAAGWEPGKPCRDWMRCRGGVICSVRRRTREPACALSVVSSVMPAKVGRLVLGPMRQAAVTAVRPTA